MSADKKFQEICNRMLEEARAVRCSKAEFLDGLEYIASELSVEQDAALEFLADEQEETE